MALMVPLFWSNCGFIYLYILEYRTELSVTDLMGNIHIIPRAHSLMSSLTPHTKTSQLQSLLYTLYTHNQTAPHLITSLLIGFICGGSTALGIFLSLMHLPAAHNNMADFGSLFILGALILWLGIFFLTIGIRSWKGSISIIVGGILPWLFLFCLSMQGI